MSARRGQLVSAARVLATGSRAASERAVVGRDVDAEHGGHWVTLNDRCTLSNRVQSGTRCPLPPTASSSSGPASPPSTTSSGGVAAAACAERAVVCPSLGPPCRSLPPGPVTCNQQPASHCLPPAPLVCLLPVACPPILPRRACPCLPPAPGASTSWADRAGRTEQSLSSTSSWCSSAPAAWRCSTSPPSAGSKSVSGADLFVIIRFLLISGDDNVVAWHQMPRLRSSVCGGCTRDGSASPAQSSGQ